jgi:hypothetical protein
MRMHQKLRTGQHSNSLMRNNVLALKELGLIYPILAMSSLAQNPTNLTIPPEANLPANGNPGTAKRGSRQKWKRSRK